MEEKIFKIIQDNLEIVNIACGGGDDTAIAIKHTHADYCLDKDDIKEEAKWLTNKIMEVILN